MIEFSGRLLCCWNFRVQGLCDQLGIRLLIILCSGFVLDFVGFESFVALQSFKTSPEIDFNVRCIKFNRAGRSLAIAGDTGLVVVDLVPHLSAPSDSTGGVTVCRY